jgi:putative addiction module killer protein
MVRSLHNWSESGPVIHPALSAIIRLVMFVLAATVDICQNSNYSCHMIELIKTDLFDRWLVGIRDRQARARIEARIRRLSLGNPGDVKPVGEGLSEMRIDYGPGYRVYFMQRGPLVVLLLCGGDKSSQERDIALAKTIAAQWKE